MLYRHRRELLCTEVFRNVFESLSNVHLVFRYDAEKVAAASENPEKVSEDGIEDAFDVIGEVLLGLLFVMMEVNNCIL